MGARRFPARSGGSEGDVMPADALVRVGCISRLLYPHHGDCYRDRGRVSTLDRRSLPPSMRPLVLKSIVLT